MDLETSNLTDADGHIYQINAVNDDSQENQRNWRTIGHLMFDEYYLHVQTVSAEFQYFDVNSIARSVKKTVLGWPLGLQIPQRNFSRENIFYFHFL